MANTKLKFFNKKGSPLNLEYVGPTANPELDLTHFFVSESSSPVPSTGQISFFDFSTGTLNLGYFDRNGADLSSWYSEIFYSLERGAEITTEISIYGGEKIECRLRSITDNTTYYSLTVDRVVGPNSVSDGKTVSLVLKYKDLPGGHFYGMVYFDQVSAGLYENEQIFIVQEVKNTSGVLELTYPHTQNPTSANAPIWRTRWSNDTYGNVDVSDIIFTYKIEGSDPSIGGSPSITNYQNVAIPVIKDPSDSYDPNNTGLIITDAITSSALQINVGLNSNNEGAEIYERKLIIEDITSGTPEKIIEIDFYGQIIPEDSRLDVLTNNLGRAFFLSDSKILREHDPSEPLPNYIEINEKRKELMVAGEDIFPYIGSYKGLIGALKFFGYQDLRIKEYWLNLNYEKKTLSPLLENQAFLERYRNSTSLNQPQVIEDVLDNANSGKYKLTQTYGPNKDGEYVLSVSSEDTILPSKTYKKTSLFGLYYDINKENGLVDEYGYPITEESFSYTQEEVLVKLFALQKRLKETYLPLNARIIDITGEGVYYEVYNTKSWTDTTERFDIESGVNLEIKANPDFGFIEDLRAFGVRTNMSSIITPMIYNTAVEYEVSFAGGTGNAVRFSGVTGNSPTLNLEKGKTYNFKITDSSFDFYLTEDPSFSIIDPIGVSDNGSTGYVSITINPDQTTPFYYFSSNNPSKLSGTINVVNPPVSDLGNISEPWSNDQKYTPEENLYMEDAIANFYTLKENGELVNLGDGLEDPVQFIDPATGLPYMNPLGMPVILECVVDTWDWDEMNITWDSLNLPSFTSSYSMLTWENINFSTYSEIEWIIEKPTTQPGLPYRFSHGGMFKDFYRLSHFLPSAGEYNVECRVNDVFNFRNRVFRKSLTQVSPRQIQIDAWSRYRENESYVWDQTIRSWEDYESPWTYLAEGKSHDKLSKEIPKEILDFAVYGNNSDGTQDMLVYGGGYAKGASGYFILNQDFLTIDKAYSVNISGSQYGNAIIYTTTAHNFNNGSTVYISGSSPQINGSWEIEVPTGATDYFFINKIIGAGAGIILASTTYIPGSTVNYVSSTYFTDQKVSGGGTIGVSINGRLVGSSTAKSSLQSTANSIISSVNLTKTSPDYFASSYDASENPVTIQISADPYSGTIGNGDLLSVQVSGSLTLSYADTELSGGTSGIPDYSLWNQNSEDYPDPNLLSWGVKNICWDTFYDASWDDAYAHSWSDYEYNSDWDGGFDIHSPKSGDYLKVTTGDITSPFPTGVTLSGNTLSEISESLNSASDRYVRNFQFSVSPYGYDTYSPTGGPTGTTFVVFASTGGTGLPFPTVPGA